MGQVVAMSFCPEPLTRRGWAWRPVSPPQPPWMVESQLPPSCWEPGPRPGRCSAAEITFLLIKQTAQQAVLSKLLLDAPVSPGSRVVGPARERVRCCWWIVMAGPITSATGGSQASSFRAFAGPKAPLLCLPGDPRAQCPPFLPERHPCTPPLTALTPAPWPSLLSPCCGWVGRWLDG